jgi:hypothetical protein
MNRQKIAYLQRTKRLDHRIFHLVDDTRRMEGLRLALLRELRARPGQRSLAQMIGVGRSVVRKFVEMRAIPGEENLRLMEEWAVDRPEAVPPVGSVALALLVADLPAELRLGVRRRLAAELRAIQETAGLPVPEWLKSELS